MDPISQDTLIEVFMKLPLRVVLRMRCVFRAWASTINDPIFIKCYQSRLSAKPRLVIGYHVNQNSDGLRFFESQSSHSVQPPLYSLAYRLSRRKDDSRQVGYNCVNGLICERQEIWNPCTGRIFQLPLVIPSNFSEKRFLGYDPENVQFKVLSLTLQIRYECHEEEVGQYQTITLGENPSLWRILDSTVLLWPKTNSVCINGIVYYFGGPLKKRNQTPALCNLVKFNVKTEKLDIIQIHHDIGEYLEDFKAVLDYKGKLGVLVSRDDRIFDLWLLEDIERWSKLSFSLDEDLCYYQASRLGFISVDRETGEIMFSTCDFYGRIYVAYVDVNTNATRKVLIQGIKTSLARAVAFTDYTESIFMF